MSSIDLGRGVRLHLWPERFRCATLFPDGLESVGVREPDQQNLDQAAEQGYPRNAEGVWLSLAHHEALHTIVSRWIYRTESPTLRHEAGGAHAPLYVRYHEEAIVLSLQRWRCTGEIPPALARFDLRPWGWRMEDVLRRIPDRPRALAG